MSIENKIYIVSTYDKLIPNGNGIPKLQSLTNVGWFDTFETAEEAVINNEMDIWEYSYDYAIISEVGIGFYQVFPNEKFYKYNIETCKYEEIEKPKELSHMCGFWS